MILVENRLKTGQTGLVDNKPLVLALSLSNPGFETRAGPRLENLRRLEREQTPRELRDVPLTDE